MRRLACNGKDLISLVNEWIKREYRRSSSRAKLLGALTPDDICDEMKMVISILTGK